MSGRARPRATGETPGRKGSGRQEVFRHRGGEYRVVRMPADGNCLFHSLAFCLGRGCDHVAVRRRAVQHVVAHWDRRFGPALGAYLSDGATPVRTAPGYAAYMARPGVFGGDAELCAASEVYGARVEVFVRARPQDRPHVYDGGSKRSAVRLLFSGGPDRGHYDAVMPLREFSSAPPAGGGDTAVSGANPYMAYNIAFSTLFLLCFSLLAVQLSMTPVKY
ncbi:uncharacterized protein LOC134538636 [Bacillus rossius redtenbacheri]|uniref:uncharacterized protein LOC134538636 n=1 Tax=Bacillus rossius redtenbacheri TaxID=93214 RepID=UPI002FDD8999